MRRPNTGQSCMLVHLFIFLSGLKRYNMLLNQRHNCRNCANYLQQIMKTQQPHASEIGHGIVALETNFRPLRRYARFQLCVRF